MNKIPFALLVVGFPAWFYYWLTTAPLLIYLYAIMGYTFLMIAAAGFASREYKR